VLDDGFQHFDLHRNADIVAIAAEDLDAWTLPSGRLREPFDAAAAADAFILLDDAVNLGGRPAWTAQRRLGPAVLVDGSPLAPSHGPVLAVAGIADPAAFGRGLRSAGWTIARELGFRDHYRYSRGDVRRIFDSAREAKVAAVVTTEKDLVRLLPFRPFPVAVAVVPLVVEIDAIDTFDAWLRGRLSS
jgi:tetraacyldisaccharide 4'-kinase